LGLLATTALEVVLFRKDALFPALPSFFKCILEVVFCEGVQHCLQFFLYYLNCQNGSLSVVSSIGKQRKVGWVTCCFWSKIPWWKRKC
jgi:hypothetical protein